MRPAAANLRQLRHGILQYCRGMFIGTGHIRSQGDGHLFNQALSSRCNAGRTFLQPLVDTRLVACSCDRKQVMQFDKGIARPVQVGKRRAPQRLPGQVNGLGSCQGQPPQQGRCIGQGIGCRCRAGENLGRESRVGGIPVTQRELEYGHMELQVYPFATVA